MLQLRMLIKILCYNIHKGRHWSGFKKSLVQMKHLIISSGADIVLLQEVVGERLLKSAVNESQLEYLADSIWPHSSYGKNAVYSRGHHGNAILSKFPIVKTRNYDLTFNRFEKRGLLHASVELSANSDEEYFLNLFCTHLNLLHSDRCKQYAKVSEVLLNDFGSENACVLAGDFNDWNKRSHKYFEDNNNLKECFLTLNGELAKSFPSFLPILSLDRVFVKNVQTTKASILNGREWENFSDHLPLLVEIDI